MSMRKSFLALCLLAVGSTSAMAAGGLKPVDARIDLDNEASLQRGAKLFVNHCLSCHSANYMRYNRLGEDLGLTDEQVADNLMFATRKIGNTMSVSMSSRDAEQWFGVVPPDLTVVSRSRGDDWLYTYLMTFYKDESRPMGMNNLMFPSVGMPHVLESIQGVQVLKAEGTPGYASANPIERLELASPGSRSPGQFSKDMRDLVNYLSYMGEPAKLERYSLGMKVLLFLFVLTYLTRCLYKEYWKDVH